MFEFSFYSEFMVIGRGTSVIGIILHNELLGDTIENEMTCFYIYRNTTHKKIHDIKGFVRRKEGRLSKFTKEMMECLTVRFVRKNGRLSLEERKFYRDEVKAQVDLYYFGDYTSIA